MDRMCNMAKILITTLLLLFSCLINLSAYAAETTMSNDALLYAKVKPYDGSTYISPTVSLDTGLTISSKGIVYIWGFRGAGLQGNGVRTVANTRPPAPVMKFVNDNLKIIEVKGGAYHFIALAEDNTVWGWGKNNDGQAAPTDTNSISTPQKLMDNVIQIGAGEYMTYMLTKSGEVYTMGSSYYGQRGDGSKQSDHRNIIRKVILPEKIRLLGGGYESGYAIAYSGTIYAWGDNEDCAFGYAYRDTKTGLQIFDDNACGDRDYVNPPEPLDTHNIFNGKEVKYIGGGQAYTTVLLENGKVYGIGRAASIGLDQKSIYDGNSGIPREIPVPEPVQSIYVRFLGTIAIGKSGKLYTWGQTGGSAFPTIYGFVPTERRPNLEPGERIVKIDGGKEHFYYHTNKGKMFGVGYGAAHKLDNTTSSNQKWPGARMQYVEDAIKNFESKKN
jgi:alpha-tubulin suppressor-like RCC1 family protein